jgi:hypothetical protein
VDTGGVLSALGDQRFDLEIRRHVVGELVRSHPTDGRQQVSHALSQAFAHGFSQQIEGSFLRQLIRFAKQHLRELEVQEGELRVALAAAATPTATATAASWPVLMGMIVVVTVLVGMPLPIASISSVHRRPPYETNVA